MGRRNEMEEGRGLGSVTARDGVAPTDPASHHKRLNWSSRQSRVHYSRSFEASRIVETHELAGPRPPGGERVIRRCDASDLSGPRCCPTQLACYAGAGPNATLASCKRTYYAGTMIMYETAMRGALRWMHIVLVRE